MPVITMCSTKGGVGKTTIAMILAQVFAATGRTVELIDADPNQPLATWRERFKDSVPKHMTVTGGIDEETILGAIKTARDRAAAVIVDVEGSANMTLARAILKSDLILVPMQSKQLDVDQAGRVERFIQQQEEVLERSIPFRIVFSRNQMLRTREETHVRAELARRQIPVLGEGIVERAAFSAIFQLGGSLYEMTKADVSSIEKAVDNANRFASAVVDALSGRNERIAA